MQASKCVTFACTLLRLMLPLEDSRALEPAAVQRWNNAMEHPRHARQLIAEDVHAVARLVTGLRQAACGELKGLKAEVDLRQLAVEQSRALGTLRCAHLGCTNLAGGSEAQLESKRCSGCKTERFCSDACSQAAWRQLAATFWLSCFCGCVL
jgi:hypothetical protein